MFRRLFSGLGKGEPAPDLAAMQSDIVRSVVENITDLYDGEWEDREWVYLAINHEILVEEGQRSSSQCAVLAHLPGGELEYLAFRLSRDSKQKLLALRDAMAKASGDKSPWTILDLTVERSGQFAFAFSYEPPPRLNGNLLHTPLSDLLERYLEQQK